MAIKRLGGQTIKFQTPVSVLSFASVVGKKEGEGPLGKSFDIISDDTTFGESSWEKSESRMQKDTLSKALLKANLSPCDINYIFAGDLLNQCIGTAFGIREFNIPFFGLYGACSTMSEAISLSCIAIDGGFADKCVALSSSHFCSAERQYRYPLEYGSQRTPTAQWTVTGSGALILSNSPTKGPVVTHVTTGNIVDLGVKDVNNMGAAMAPAAFATLSALFKDTASSPFDYDLIVTGDLGAVGKACLIELFRKQNIDISKNYDDCGCMIFDIAAQDVNAGGSGCGCSASVLCGHLLGCLNDKTINKIIFAGTGALLSPTSSLQGQTIPSVCHAVVIENL